MAKKQPNLYAMLFVRPRYEEGIKAYWIWELILFHYPLGTACLSCGNLVGAGRFGSQKVAVEKAEYYAKLLNIEINERSLMG